MIFAIGAFIAFSLSPLASTKRARTRPDVWLGLWLAVIGLHLSLYCGQAEGTACGHLNSRGLGVLEKFF